MTPDRAILDSPPSESGPAAALPRFAEFPVSWYFFGPAAAVRRGPVSLELFGRRLVAFQTSGGEYVVLEAQCSHLGTDLGCGRVVGDTIQCPYHNWRYDATGRCVHIPATNDIPAFARQRRYPVTERHGHLYVFHGREPLFPLPFFDELSPADLICSPAHAAELECPWYMIGGNAFDAQHFSASHDREMISVPHIDCPSPYARRAAARFAVTGNSLQDRLTRLLAGPEVGLTVTDYCGNMMLVTATFRRTRTYGLVVTTPLAKERVLVRVMVLKRRSRFALLRAIVDPISVAIRHRFITRFLSADAVRLVGVRYNPARTIPADDALVRYFQWLAVVSHGRPSPPLSSP